MAISPGFVIKHIRPFGDGYEAYCNDGMIDLLRGLRFAFPEIVQIFALWRNVSEADPHGQSDQFVAAAREVAMARWAELYPTNESTLMFLTRDQLASLSLAGERAGANRQVNWNYGAELPICVTINHETGAYHIRWNAMGCVAGTDEQGNINHFVRLL